MAKGIKKALTVTTLVVCCLALAGTVALAMLRSDWQGWGPASSTEVVSLIGLTSEALNPTPPPPPEPEPVHFLAVGDNLIHPAIYLQAAGADGYDFSPAYAHVKDRIADADIACINQETVMAASRKPSGYPAFNSPTALGDQLVDFGFDVFNLANNHTLDMGASGLTETLEFWNTKPVITVGAYLDDTVEPVRTMEKNGLTFAFLGATELTNGLSLPEDSPLVLMRTGDEAFLEERIRYARSIADVVVVNVHWGIEYSSKESTAQRKLAQKMADWGADLIVGHHPHVLQPMGYLTRADGSRALVVYSLGNFISAQDEPYRMVGGMLELDIKKGQEGLIFENVVMTPVITHYGENFGGVTNYLLPDYTDALAAVHGCQPFSMEYIDGLVRDAIPAEFLPNPTDNSEGGN